MEMPRPRTLVLTLLLAGLSKAVDRGELRLSGGQQPTEGRVEVYYDGEWGTVCDDGWDLTDANVVCRSLGFLNATEATIGGVFGSGSGTILMDEVACAGTETSLTLCKSRGWKVHDCQHSEDAGARCDPRRWDHFFGYRLDLTAELRVSLQELYASRRDCDLNITVIALETGREQMRSCVHRLVLALHNDGNTISRSDGPNVSLLLSQDCVQYVEGIIRYFYTKTIDVTLASVKCIHNMASDYGVTAVRDHCDRLFYKLLPQDPSFRHQLELYNYAEAVEDPLLKEVCLEYLAWNCQAFMQSLAWPEVTAEELDTLLQRSDLAVPSELSLYRALERWLETRGRGDAADLLLSRIRFPMMSPEELVSLPAAVGQQLRPLLTPRLLEAFQFHAVAPERLRLYTDLSQPRFRPRLYTSPAWSCRLELAVIPRAQPAAPARRHPAYSRTGRYGGRFAYPGQDSQRAGPPRDPASPGLYFYTSGHRGGRQSWAAYYHASRAQCRAAGLLCPYDTYPVAVLSARGPAARPDLVPWPTPGPDLPPGPNPNPKPKTKPPPRFSRGPAARSDLSAWPTPGPDLPPGPNPKPKPKPPSRFARGPAARPDVSPGFARGPAPARLARPPCPPAGPACSTTTGCFCTVGPSWSTPRR
ncbi:galectin-3-binding protein-like [Amblyraja radiata]|uniref:galectin-3-binding protein-like n=1 Tax=Amblyraja radiata TaxID=386614 RepID=UPI001401D334|nr:galectin-3-binding protein-like [Amblyraja radiata]